jgi:hypothetical protein
LVGEENLTERVYGDLGGIAAEARRINGRRMRNLPIGTAFGAAIGFLLSLGTIYDRYSHVYTLDRFLALLPRFVFLGGIIGLSLATVLALYNPYPRNLSGPITLDRVEEGKLWFYGKNGKRNSISLPRQTVNVHDEQTIHFGLPPKVLELKTQTIEEMKILTTALSGQVRIFRPYGGPNETRG